MGTDGTDKVMSQKGTSPLKCQSASRSDDLSSGRKKSQVKPKLRWPNGLASFLSKYMQDTHTHTHTKLKLRVYN